MKAKALMAVPLAAAAVLGAAGCTPVATTCTVRHRYAIVIFQNGVGNGNRTLVSRFRLNVRYGSDNVEHWLIRARMVLNAASGKNSTMDVRTYHVGAASACSVDEIRARQ